MSGHWIPNLRRDLPISVVLLIMAVAAVVPGGIAVIIALAGITGLMLLRLTMGRMATPPLGVVRDSRPNPPPERTISRGGSHATHTA
jgi:hypothetical protein